LLLLAALPAHPSIWLFKCNHCGPIGTRRHRSRQPNRAAGHRVSESRSLEGGQTSRRGHGAAPGHNRSAYSSLTPVRCHHVSVLPRRSTSETTVSTSDSSLTRIAHAECRVCSRVEMASAVC
jgi:hypothetical protein